MSCLLLICCLVLCCLLFYRSPYEMFVPLPISSGSRRNMSLDVRGDPYIPYTAVSPWNQPEVLPIRNREMYMA